MTPFFSVFLNFVRRGIALPVLLAWLFLISTFGVYASSAPLTFAPAASPTGVFPNDIGGNAAPWGNTAWVSSALESDPANGGNPSLTLSFPMADNFTIYRRVTPTGGADTTPPTIVGCVNASSTRIIIEFSEPIDMDSVIANCSGVFQISGGIAVTSASVDPRDGKKVIVVTATNIANRTITVNGVRDLAGNAIAPNSTVNLVYASSSLPVLPAELRLYDYPSQQVPISIGATKTTYLRMASNPGATTTVTISKVSGESYISLTSSPTLTFTTANYLLDQAVTFSASQVSDIGSGQAIYKATASTGAELYFRVCVEWEKVGETTASDFSWKDTSVQVGVLYEYQIASTRNLVGYGAVTLSNQLVRSYVCGGVKVDKTGYRGRMILLLDASQSGQLGAEIAQLKEDLTGDGWFVETVEAAPNAVGVNLAGQYAGVAVPGADQTAEWTTRKAAIVAAGSNVTGQSRDDWKGGASVVSVKNAVKSVYDAAPVGDKPKLLYILGHVPQAWSGGRGSGSASVQKVPPDGHENHHGALPADSYYADMDGTWGDGWLCPTTNEKTQGNGYNARQYNFAGDSIWDTWKVASAVEMGYGRVDMRGLRAFEPLTETELLRRYLDKAHDYRHGQGDFANTGRKALFNSGHDQNNMVAMGQFPAIVGMENFLFDADDDAKLDQPKAYGPYLMFCLGGGGGSLAGWDDIHIKNLARHDNMNAVFWSGWQSFYYDWADNDSWYRGMLAAEGKSLVFSAHTTTYFWQHLGLGEPFGTSIKASVNNDRRSGLYPFVITYPQYDTGGAFVSMMGDPALRLFSVKPPSGLTATASGNDVELAWSASPDSGIQGYDVWVSTTGKFGSYTKVNGVRVGGTSFTHTNAPVGAKHYMVRAVKLDTTGAGTLLNPSQGIFASVGVNKGTASANPAVLAMGARNAVGATPGSVTISGMGGALTAVSGASWLTVGVAGNTLTLTPNSGADSLIKGDHWTSIKVSAAGAEDFYLPVQMTVTGDQELYFSAHDSTVDGTKADRYDANYNGGWNTVEGDLAPSNVNKKAYMRFDCRDSLGKTVSNARLRFYVCTTGTAATPTMDIHPVADDSWDEATLTWNNRPTVIGTKIATVNVNYNSWVELDVTSYLNEEIRNGNGLASFYFSANASMTMNGNGSTAPPQLIVTYSAAAPALRVSTENLPVASSGVSYTTALQATNGTAPYTWSIVSGTLPPGLSLVGSTGVISGVPTTDQQKTFTVRVTDSGSATSEQSLTIGSTLNAPGALLATAMTGPMRVAVSWNDNSSDETGYVLQRKAPGEADFSDYQTLAAGAAAYSDTAVNSDSLYSYRVKAVRGTQSSAYSATASATTSDSTAPVLLRCANADGTKILLWFSEPLDFVTAQNIANYAVGGGVSVVSATIDPRDPTLVILTTSGIAASQTVTVNNVADLAGNAVASNSQIGMSYSADGTIILINETLDSNPGWTMDSGWGYGVPTGGGNNMAAPNTSSDPTAGNTGSNVYGYNLAGVYGVSLTEKNLTTPKITISSKALVVTLTYWRWLGVEDGQYDHAYVRVSGDGNAWATVWENPVGANVTDAAWSQRAHDISSAVAGGDSFYVRWVMGDTDGSGNYAGWNLDDIRVTATYNASLPPGIELGASRVTVNEGGTATIQVRLASAPAIDTAVTVDRASGDSEIAVVSGASLVFTPANYSVWQTVTVACEPDSTAVADRAVFKVASGGGALAYFDVVETETGTNVPPVVMISSPSADVANIAATDSLFLVGTASDAELPGGSIGYTWSKVSGPGTVSFGNANAKDTSVAFSQVGTYVLRLSANDGQYMSSEDRTILVTGSGVKGALEGLAAYLPLDETAGVTAGNLLDASKPGTLGGTAPTWNAAGGKYGGYLNFAGAGNVNLGAASQFPIAPTQDYTMSVWFKAENQSNKALFSAGTYAVTKNAIIYTGTDKITGVVGGSTAKSTSGTVYAGGAWHLATLVNSGGAFTVYFDDGTVSVSGTSGTTVPAVDLLLGQARNANNTDLEGGFTGDLDDFRIYSRALSVDEVADLYNGAANRLPFQITQNSPTMANVGESVAMDVLVLDASTGNPAVCTVFWSKASGPGTVAFSDASALNPSVSFSEKGTYRLRVVAFDSHFASVSEVDVEVGIPVITSQPTAAAVSSGNSASMSVGAFGSPLSYQWYQGNSGDTSNAVGGATAAVFTTEALTQTTSYWVRVTNAATGEVRDSDTVTVTVITAPAITAQPAGLTVNSGGTATASLTATGGGLIYQWYEGNSGDTATPIGGATSASYTSEALTAPKNFWCRVSNIVGTVDSGTVEVSVRYSLDAVADARIQGSATYNATNYGTKTTLFLKNAEYNSSNDQRGLIRWDLSSIPSNFEVASAEVVVNVSTAGASMTGNFYECKQPWAEGTVTYLNYDTGLVWPLDAGIWGTSSFGNTVLGSADFGTSGSKTATFNASGIVLVQSWLATPAGNKGLILYNSGTAQVRVDTRESANKPQLKVVCKLPSAPVISVQPQGATIASGGTHTMSVTASGAASYQWYEGARGDMSVPIAGATSSGYTTAALSADKTYWVKVTNAGGTSAYSEAVAVVIQAVSVPEMAVSRSGALADGGTDSVSGTVAGSGTQLTYMIANSGSGALSLTVPVMVGGQTNCAVTVNTQPPASVVAGASASLVVTVTPTAAGAWSFTLSVANDDTDENPYNWTVGGTAQGAFEAWAAGKGLNGGGAGVFADGDGDGIVNLVEFALNANPAISDGSKQPAVVVEGSDLVLRYRKNKGATGLVYTVESSSDLGSWTTEGSGSKESDADGETEVWKVAKPVGTKLFLRLKVSKP